MSPNNPKKSHKHQVICELETAKLLNSFYSSEVDEKRAENMEFRRAPRSGGFDKRLYPGDIHGPPWFRLNVECKFDQSITTDTLFYGTLKMRSWFAQAASDCVICRTPRLPVVVVRIMRRPLLAFLPMADYIKMVEAKQTFLNKLEVNPSVSYLILGPVGGMPQLIGINLQDLCEQFPNRETLEVATQWLKK